MQHAGHRTTAAGWLSPDTDPPRLAGMTHTNVSNDRG